MLWVLNRMPRRSDSNEYPQHTFLWRTVQNYPLIIIKYPCYLFHCRYQWYKKFCCVLIKQKAVLFWKILNAAENLAIRILWIFVKQKCLSEKKKKKGNFLCFNTDCVAEMLFPKRLIEGCREQATIKHCPIWTYVTDWKKIILLISTSISSPPHSWHTVSSSAVMFIASC